jgi:hypothetical protein
MCLTFGGESDALSVPLEIVSGRRYELPVGPFYDLAFKTHGELFRSLSGVIILGAEDAEIDAIFSVGRRERGYWASGDARFAVGPLGLDSVLQTAVFASVLHGDGGNESYFSKLPVELGDWALLRPFDETAEYTCRCRVVETSGRDMKLCATVIDGDGAPVLDAHHTLLREAPFVRFTRGEIHETLRQYERAS